MAHYAKDCWDAECKSSYVSERFNVHDIIMTSLHCKSMCSSTCVCSLVPFLEVRWQDSDCIHVHWSNKWIPKLYNN